MIKYLNLNNAFLNENRFYLHTKICISKKMEKLSLYIVHIIDPFKWPRMNVFYLTNEE